MDGAVYRYRGGEDTTLGRGKAWYLGRQLAAHVGRDRDGFSQAKPETCNGQTCAAIEKIPDPPEFETGARSACQDRSASDKRRFDVGIGTHSAAQVLS